jgi:PAS domain S-box-containing protein
MEDRKGSVEQEVGELEQLRRRVALLEARERGDSELMLESIIRSIPDIIYRLDAEGNILYISEAIRSYGYDPKELIGRSIFSLVHPEDRDKAAYRINERRTGERRTQLLELRLLARDKRPVEFEFAPAASEEEPTLLVNAEGIYSSGLPKGDDFLYTQGVARDITDRKWATRALEKAKEDLSKRVAERTAELQQVNQVLKREMERFRQFAEELPVGVVRNKPEGKILYFNAYLRDLLGYSLEELLELNACDLYIDPEDRRNLVAHLEAKGEHTYEYRLRCKDGRVIWVHGTTRVVEGEGREKIYQGFVEDITERKHLGMERDKLEEQLRNSQKLEAVGQLTAGVAHNFNNMLQGVIGNLYLAQLDAAEEVQPFLGAAQAAADRAAEMVRQLMVFAQQGVPIACQAIDWFEVVRNTLEICRATFDPKIEIIEDLPEGEGMVEGDPGQLRQVVINLMLNARDALEEMGNPNSTVCISGGRVATKVKPGMVSRSGPYLGLRIEDNGVGMTGGTRERIFEPFFTTKPVDRGTGLGLSTAYAIVQQHGGWIECESEMSRGTRMSIFLPLESEVGTGEVGEGERGMGEYRGTVLIVDDEEVVRGPACEFLVRSGFEVMVARDGEEGMEVFRRERKRIGLVFLDLSMPGMSGEEMLVELRAIDPDMPVVIFTGHLVEEEDFVGVQGVLQKPFSLEGVLEKALDVLEERGRV